MILWIQRHNGATSPLSGRTQHVYKKWPHGKQCTSTDIGQLCTPTELGQRRKAELQVNRTSIVATLFKESINRMFALTKNRHVHKFELGLPNPTGTPTNPGEQAFWSLRSQRLSSPNFWQGKTFLGKVGLGMHRIKKVCHPLPRPNATKVLPPSPVQRERRTWLNIVGAVLDASNHCTLSKRWGRPFSGRSSA